MRKYADAVARRQQLVADAARLFEDIDVLLTPATAVPAFPAEGPPTEVIDGEATSPRGAGATPFTMLANLCWNPAISVPAGLNSEQLPVGLQVIGRAFDEATVLRVADAYERAAGFADLRPPLVAAA